MLEKTLESPLDCKKIKPVKPKGNQSWILSTLEGLTLKLKLQYFGHLMRRADSLEKTDAGKDWRQEEKGTTENEMVGWHYRLNGHEFEQVPGDSEGQGDLAWCSPWGNKQLDMTEQLNNKLVQALQRVVQRFLKKLKIELSYDPEIHSWVYM